MLLNIIISFMFIMCLVLSTFLFVKSKFPNFIPLFPFPTYKPRTIISPQLKLLPKIIEEKETN